MKSLHYPYRFTFYYGEAIKKKIEKEQAKAKKKGEIINGQEAVRRLIK